jgi:tetratricopeptide (TPR) repeat protein
MAFAASPALQAQNTDRLAILTPAFEAVEGARGNFGKDVVKEFNKLLEDYLTHRPVDQKVLRDALKRFGIKEEQLGGYPQCVFGQQLATQIDIDLVMCGSFSGAEGAYRVKATVWSPEISEKYEMPEFNAADPKDAAAKISQEFQKFTEGLKVAVFCQEYAQSQTWPSAIENCQRAIDMNPQNKSATHALAYALWKSADTAPEGEKLQLQQRAKQLFLRELEIDNIAQEAMMALGILTAEMGDTDEAMNHFRDYLELNPNDVQVRRTLAADAAKAGGFEAAVRLLEDGMSNATGQELLDLQAMAGSYAMQGAFQKMQESTAQPGELGQAQPLIEKGVDYLTKVYNSQTDNPDVASARSILTGLRLLGRLDEAQTFGTTAIQKHADDANLWSSWADVLGQAEKTQEALAALDRLEQIDPAYQLLNYRRATWNLKLDNIDAAVAAAQKGVQAGDIQDAQADALARSIAYQGYTKGRESGNSSAGIPYYNAAGELARTDETRGMIAFFHGSAIYAVAAEREKAETKASAEAAKPMFQQVVAMMQQAAPYTSSQPQLEQARTNLLTNARAYIERQDAIIKRGR